MKIDLVLVWADPYLSDFLLEVACDIIQIVISVRLSVTTGLQKSSVVLFSVEKIQFPCCCFSSIN